MSSLRSSLTPGCPGEAGGPSGSAQDLDPSSRSSTHLLRYDPEWLLSLTEPVSLAIEGGTSKTHPSRDGCEDSVTGQGE